MSVLKLTKENFYDIIQQEQTVLVEFQAPWCGYCRRIESAFQAVAQEQSICVGAVNIDDDEPLADAYSVELVPTLILFQNGKPVANIVNPGSKAEIDAFLNENTEKETVPSGHIYDMIVIGGGPGGYTAALYAARAGLDTLVLEKLSAGGQMAETQQIDNYPGFEQGIDGFALGLNMQKQAERFGVTTKLAQAHKLSLTGPVKTVETSDSIFHSKTVVIATGANHKHLGIEQEEALIGKGVAYCASCDGMFYRNKTVAVVGGGNSAAADALLLSRIAKKVILIHRRDTLRATKVYHDPLMQADNIEFHWNSRISQLLHDDKLSGVQIENVHSGEKTILDVDGLFISIGREPATQLLQGQVDLDENGYVIADESTQTNLPGVYAIGDVRTKAVRQIVTAVADGAVAVHYAEEYLVKSK